jgi:hypothetical protein
VYSIIIFRQSLDNLDEIKEVKRFNERTYTRAEAMFSHHLNNLTWSRQHKLNMGLKPDDVGKVQLFDHDAGFELKEMSF